MAKFKSDDIEFELFFEKWWPIKSQLMTRLDMDTSWISTGSLGADIVVKSVFGNKDKDALVKEEFDKTIEMSNCADVETLYECCQRMADLCQGLDYGPAGAWFGIFCEEILEKYKDAQYWYTRAASLGNGLGMYRVGLLYLNKKAPLPQATDLKRCFTDALDHGIVDAQAVIDEFFSNKTEEVHEEVLLAMTDEEKYGKAWLLIVGKKDKDRGLQMMRELDNSGFIEGTIALSMFCDNPSERKALIKKAADAGNPEGLWEYTGFLPRSFIPNPQNAADALWEKTCIEAAEMGSADAMNEMGNVFHRRRHFSEAMYWYAMANAYDHPDGRISMSGIAREWQQNGCPREYVKGSKKFDEARHKCAIAYLELNSGTKLSSSFDEICKLVLDGVPIAGYLAGYVFESTGNDEMAYKMYNALAIENDAHALKCCADMMYAGKGTQKNQQGAINMFLMAAEAGDLSAMFVAGEINRATNKNKAAYWYGVSHSRGYALSLQRLQQLAD